MRKEIKCTLREALARLLATRPTPVDEYRNSTGGLNPERPATLVEWDREDIGERGMAVMVYNEYAVEVATWRQRK